MTPLNRALAFGPDGKPKPTIGLGAKLEVREALVACDGLLRLMMEQPSHITEIVPPDLPHFYCYVDFAATGMGGVILPCTKWIQPSVWRFKNPPDIEALARKSANYRLVCPPSWLGQCVSIASAGKRANKGPTSLR